MKVVFEINCVKIKHFVNNTGSGCDILLHEATMEDELKDEAKDRNHRSELFSTQITIKTVSFY